jgi:hypothetical protein
LFGGMIASLMVSVINVTGSFFVGYLGIRYIFVRNKNVKMVSVVGTLFFMSCIILLLLSAAHYRDILEENISNPNTIHKIGGVFKHAVSDPVNFKTFHAYALLVLGLIISAISIWKGITFDSYFPSYGDISRKHRNADRSYKKFKNKVYDECYVLINKSTDDIISEVNLTIDNCRDIPTLYKYLCEKYSNWLKRKQNECHADLKRYRETNQLIRTEKPPKYFSEFPNIIEDYFLTSEKIEENEELLDKLRDNISSLYGQFDKIKKSLYKELDDELIEFINKFESIEKHTENDLNNE